MGYDAEKFDTLLRAAVGSEKVRSEEPMACHTTFRTGGPAEWFVTPDTFEGIASVVALCRGHGVPLRIAGRGSNLLVADEGVRGVVLAIGDGFSRIEVRGCEVEVQAGATNAAVADRACDAGLSGYEFARGIPGTVGGAAIMNAGAYDGEFSQVCVGVRCLTPDGSLVEVPAREAAWGYRRSMMGDSGYIVVSATLRLRADDPSAIRARMDDFARRRREKQPLEFPSAGSTFKRPTGYYAGALIDEAGLRGYRVGDAQVSEKHAGFVVNLGAASAADIARVIEDVRDRVRERSGVLLEPEVRMWGFEDLP